MSDTTATNETKSDRKSNLPKGFEPVTQTRQWVVKEEGSVLQGVLLAMPKRKNPKKDDETAFFYEVMLEQPIKVVTGDNKVPHKAEAGSLVCIDNFSGINSWKHLLPSPDGKGWCVWLQFLTKDKLPNGNTMWKTEQGKQARSNLAANISNVNRTEDVSDDEMPF